MSTRESDEEAGRYWQAAPSESLVWVGWGDDFVAYHRPSGKTHFLNRSSHHLIAELLQEAQPTEAVAAVFHGENADRAATHRDILGLLEHLEELGLIDRADPIR